MTGREGSEYFQVPPSRPPPVYLESTGHLSRFDDRSQSQPHQELRGLGDIELQDQPQQRPPPYTSPIDALPRNVYSPVIGIHGVERLDDPFTDDHFINSPGIDSPPIASLPIARPPIDSPTIHNGGTRPSRARPARTTTGTRLRHFRSFMVRQYNFWVLVSCVVLIICCVVWYMATQVDSCEGASTADNNSSTCTSLSPTLAARYWSQGATTSTMTTEQRFIHPSVTTTLATATRLSLQETSFVEESTL